MMPFQFIDNNSEIDPTARRRIRCHAATGKNVGRTILRPSKKNLIGPKPAKVTAPSQILQTRVTRATVVKNEQNSVLKIERQIGSGLSGLFLPAELSGEPLKVVHRGMFPILLDDALAAMTMIVNIYVLNT